MLIKCKECYKEVSNTAQRCPHCGAKLRLSGFIKVVLSFVTAVVTLIAIFAVKAQFDPQYVRDANVSRAICEDNIGKSPAFTQSICDFNYNRAIAAGEPNSGIAAPRNYEAEAEYAENQKKLTAELKISCTANKKSIQAEYTSFAKQGDWWAAGLKVWNCASATNDPDYVRWGDKATKMNEKQAPKQ